MLCESPELLAEASYFDHAAITPLREEAHTAMCELAGDMGNPSSVHSVGRRARCHVEEARESIAELLGARPSEVIFVASGTEADNLALKGMALARAEQGYRRLLLSAVEHHSVTDAATWLASYRHDVFGVDLDVLPVDQAGRVELSVVRERLHQSDIPLLMTVMAANNEVGTVQPVAELADAAAAAGVPFHVDAVQAVTHMQLDFSHPGITTMSVASQKFGGPTGIGVLLARRDAPLVPLFHGGGQERGLRAGTQNVLGIVGMAAALQAAVARQADETARLVALRHKLITGLHKVCDDVIINGPEKATEGADSPVLPGIVSASFPGCEGDALLMLLDGKGISVSLGAACTAGVAHASEVLLAMGVPEPQARGTLRLSMGHTTTPQHVDDLLQALPEAVERARLAGLA